MSSTPTPPGTPPPGHASYPPSQAFPSAPSQPLGPIAPPASVILLLAFAPMLIGVILRCIGGMMKSPDGVRAITWIGNLMLAVGLFAAAYAMLAQGLKDQDKGPAVRALAIVAGVLLIMFGIIVSSNALPRM